MSVGGDILLDDEALLDFLVSKGRRTQRSRKAVKSILAEWPTLAKLDAAPISAIARVSSLPRNSIDLLKAAVELGRRTVSQEQVYSTEWKLSDQRLAIEYCDYKFAGLKLAPVEEIHVVTLNAKGIVIDAHLVTRGTLRNSLVHPREFFKPALLDHANTVIAVHNHPSGDPTPSELDIQVTKRLIGAGELLGINLLDHIIVGKHGTRSIRDDYPLWAGSTF